MVDGPQGQYALDRRISIDILRPALRGTGIAPRGEGLFIDPQRQAPPVDQRRVILTPVANAVLRLLFHAGAVSALAIHATMPCSGPNASSAPPAHVRSGASPG